VGTGEQSARQYAIMKDLVFRNPRIGPAIVKPLIEIDQQLLAQQKGQLEFQSKAMDLIAQGAAAVEAQPPEARAEAYGQWRNVLMQRGIPGVAQQLPEQYDPQRVAALGTQARTAKERIDQQREQHQLEINAYDKETERLKLGEVGIHSGAFRDTPYYKNPFAAERLQREGGGAPGGAGARLPQVGGPSTPAVAPYRAAQEAELKDYVTQGSEARKVHVALDEAERLMQEGVYDQSKGLTLAIETYRRLGPNFKDWPGAAEWDEAKLAKTARLRQIGYEVKLARTKLGAGTSDAEGRAFSEAAGNIENGQPLEMTRQAIGSLRKFADTALTATNEAMQNARGDVRAPVQGRNTGGVRPVTRYTDADVQAAVAQANAGGKRNLTPQQIEQYFQSKGMVRGN
jgi:hypothetical protein